MTRTRKTVRTGSRAAASATVEGWLSGLTQRLAAQDYAGVVEASGRILRDPATRPAQRADALSYLGIAHMMLGEFDRSYRALSEALRFDPEDSYIWFNRGLVARYTMRAGQSLRDLERAIALEGDGEDAARFGEEVAFSRQLVEQSLLVRGPDFTLDQLVEQEELFQRGSDLLQAGQWRKAEEVFRRVIAMADVLPQPWGNLGVCLINQRRFDEAEGALNRALEIDPAYEPARHNLSVLPQLRLQDRSVPVNVTSPFPEGPPPNSSVSFVQRARD